MRALLSVLLLAATIARADKVLDVEPVEQATPVWCWVAVSEMVLRYYDVPNVNPGGHYQCGFIGLNAVATNAQACNADCRLCNFPAGHANVLKSAFEEYPRRVALVKSERQPRLRMTIRARALSFDEVMEEIDNERPFIIGISPAGSPVSNVSAHVAVIRGYKDEGGRSEVLVNDPFPFERAGSPNPYLRAGGSREEDLSYWIDIEALKQRLAWRETMLVRKSGTHAKPPATQAASLCVVNPYGGGCRMAPGFSLPKGAQCHCAGVPGVAF